MFNSKTLLAIVVSASMVGPSVLADAYPNCADLQVSKIVDDETAKFAALQPFDEYIQFNCLDKNKVLRTNGINFYQVNDTLRHEIYYGFPTDAARPPAKQIVPVAIAHHFWQGRLGAVAALTATVLAVVATRRYIRSRPTAPVESAPVASEPVFSEPETDVIHMPLRRPRAFLVPDAVSAESIGFPFATGDIPVSKLILARADLTPEIPTYSGADGQTWIVQTNPDPQGLNVPNAGLEAIEISDTLAPGQSAWTPEIYKKQATGTGSYQPSLASETLEPGDEGAHDSGSPAPTNATSDNFPPAAQDDAPTH